MIMGRNRGQFVTAPDSGENSQMLLLFFTAGMQFRPVQWEAGQ